MKLEGLGKLNRRLNAIADQRELLRKVQIKAVAEAKQLVPRGTGHLARSILPGSLTDTSAIVSARVNYAMYVEFGTGLYGPKKKKYPIVPKNKKALAWPATAAGRRLSGRANLAAQRNSPGLGAARAGTSHTFSIRRVGSIGPSSGSMRFAKAVMHPGVKARPFMIPGAKKAVEGGGLKAVVVDEWNKAA